MAELTDDERATFRKQYRTGVNEDGTVEDCIVETYLAFVYAIYHPRQYGYEVDHQNKFVSFAIDNGATDLEVRLPFETVAFLKQCIDEGPQADKAVSAKAGAS